MTGRRRGGDCAGRRYRSRSVLCCVWDLCCTAVQVVSSGREMTVVLVSDVSIASRGFRASWDTEPAAQCGGRLEQTAGVIAPPR